MENKNEANLPKVPEGMSLFDALKLACLALGTPVEEENTRPEYILCDEIWDILAEAGHGCEIVIHKENPETLYYNDFASQTDNVHFMNHLSEAMDNGYLVTVNGTDIFDLY